MATWSRLTTSVYRVSERGGEGRVWAGGERVGGEGRVWVERGGEGVGGVGVRIVFGEQEGLCVCVPLKGNALLSSAFRVSACACVWPCSR